MIWRKSASENLSAGSQISISSGSAPRSDHTDRISLADHRRFVLAAGADPTASPNIQASETQATIVRSLSPVDSVRSKTRTFQEILI
jgi:hypothetical protein